MFLLYWLQSLLPRLTRTNIIDDLDITNKELSEGVIPAYSEAVKYLNKQFKAKVLSEMSSKFSSNANLGGRKSINFIMDIQQRLENIRGNLDFIAQQLSAILETDVITDGLTVKKSSLIRAGEHMSFITTFAIDLLAYVYSVESLNTLGKSATDEESEVYKVSLIQSKNVEEKFDIFSILFGKYSVDTKDFKNSFENIPDVVLNANNHSLITATFSDKNIDPMNTGGIAKGFTNNPIYHMRLVIAEFQALRYQEFKDRKRVLELRLLLLKDLNNGSVNASVQREVEYVQSRIDTLSYKMMKMQESVA